MNPSKKITNRKRRHVSVRLDVSGTSTKPRISVFRSSKHIYAQAIDDVNCVTLVSANDTKIKGKTKSEKASEVGMALAELLKKKNVNEVVFDRSGYKYHGRVKALAEGARSGGLKF